MHAHLLWDNNHSVSYREVRDGDTNPLNGTLVLLCEAPEGEGWVCYQKKSPLQMMVPSYIVFLVYFSHGNNSSSLYNILDTLTHA